MRLYVPARSTGRFGKAVARALAVSLGRLGVFETPERYVWPDQPAIQTIAPVCANCIDAEISFSLLSQSTHGTTGGYLQQGPIQHDLLH